MWTAPSSWAWRLGDGCEWESDDRALYIGTCRAVSEALICVRNKPIQRPRDRAAEAGLGDVENTFRLGRHQALDQTKQRIVQRFEKAPSEGAQTGPASKGKAGASHWPVAVILSSAALVFVRFRRRE